MPPTKPLTGSGKGLMTVRDDMTVSIKEGVDAGWLLFLFKRTALIRPSGRPEGVKTEINALSTEFIVKPDRKVSHIFVGQINEI